MPEPTALTHWAVRACCAEMLLANARSAAEALTHHHCSDAARTAASILAALDGAQVDVRDATKRARGDCSTVAPAG